MNHGEQQIYRAIKRVQFEPYDPGEMPRKRSRPFQRRMLARMLIEIRRRLPEVVFWYPSVDQWGEIEIHMWVDSASLNVKVSVDTDNSWFVWGGPHWYKGGLFKQMGKGVRFAVELLTDEGVDGPTVRYSNDGGVSTTSGIFEETEQGWVRVTP